MATSTNRPTRSKRAAPDAKIKPSVDKAAPIFVSMSSGPSGNTAAAKNSPNPRLTDAVSAITTNAFHRCPAATEVRLPQRFHSRRGCPAAGRRAMPSAPPMCRCRILATRRRRSRDQRGTRPPAWDIRGRTRNDSRSGAHLGPGERSRSGPALSAERTARSATARVRDAGRPGNIPATSRDPRGRDTATREPAVPLVHLIRDVVLRLFACSVVAYRRELQRRRPVRERQILSPCPESRDKQ
jgi:hypothetical protein